MKKFPKNFSPHSPPLPPPKPRKMITHNVELRTFDVPDYSTISIPNVEGATSLTVDVYDDYAGRGVQLRFSRQTEVPNDRYEQQMATYKEEYAAYKKLKAEWKKLKAEYDAAEKTRLKNQRRSMYDNLKKEFDGET